MAVRPSCSSAGLHAALSVCFLDFQSHKDRQVRIEEKYTGWQELQVFFSESEENEGLAQGTEQVRLSSHNFNATSSIFIYD